MNTIITSAKGFLLNFYINQNRVQMDQFKYNLTTKMFDLFNQDFLNLESEMFYLEKKILNQNDAILLFGVVSKSKVRKVLIVSFDSKRELFKFDIQFSLQLSEIFDSNSNNFNFILFPNEKKFFYFNIVNENGELVMKIFHNINNQLDLVKYHLNFEMNNITKTESLNWANIDFENEETIKYLNLKSILTLKLEGSDKGFLKNVLIDPFQGVFSLNSENLWQNFSKFNKFDTSLVEFDSDEYFLCLNKTYSNKPIELENVKIINYKIFSDSKEFCISGDCVLNFFNGNESFLIRNKNGIKNLIKKFDRKISNYDYYLYEDNYYLIVSDGDKFYQVFTLDENLDILKSVYESNQVTCVLYDYFENDSKSFLIINDLLTADFTLKKNFDFFQEEQISNSSNDFHDISIDFTNLNSNENIQNLDEKKPNNALSLLNLLEYKDRSSDLILNDSIGQVKQKLSLVVEISNLFTQNIPNFNLSNKNYLPKLVDLYVKESSYKIKSNTIHKRMFEIKHSWTCFLNQNFLFNFIFSNETNQCLNDLNCVLIVKGMEKVLECETRQLIMRLDSKMIDILTKDKIDNLDNILNSQSSHNDSKYFLLTLEFNTSFVNNILNNFSSKEFNVSILVNTNNGCDLFKQADIVKFNLLDNLVLDKVNFSSKLYLSIMNYYESSLNRAHLHLKLYDMNFKLFESLFLNRLNFENVFNNENKSIYYLNKQSIIMDSFIVVDSSKEFIRITIYANNNEQLSLILHLLNEYLSSSNVNNNYRIEIDIDENIDKLMESLNYEISSYSRTKSTSDFDSFGTESNSTENQKELFNQERMKNEFRTDNEILKLFN